MSDQKLLRRAKIICTLGPASASETMIEKLALAGMNVARVNFSHGSREQHEQLIANVRSVAEKLDLPIAVLQDLQGPKIRVGEIEGGEVELEEGASFALYTEKRVGDASGVSISLSKLPGEVSVGEEILIDDGLLRLRVTDIRDDRIDTVVENGGILRNRKGVNLPSSRLSLPAMTPKDREDLAFGVQQGVDFVALSFVRSGLDVHQLRCALPDRADDGPQIIAKIEKPQAVENIHEITAAADGIMIARGDLGVEMPPEQVPTIQKNAIALANSMGKISITATQMLESMTQNPRPTRAEASDVANAIFDGTDVVMLSAETASGNYPVQAVSMMRRIITEAEKSQFYKREPTSGPQATQLKSFPSAIARAAAAAASSLPVEAIAAFTITGSTARLIMSHRPTRDIIAFTPSERTYRRMALYWGVAPILTETCYETDTLIELVENSLVARQFAEKGDNVVIVMGVPVGRGAPTNMIKFHTVGDELYYR